jgi:phosphoribosylaminoimidazolecarboxamide formyltransferase/IMP cyclohydrolase
MDPTYTPPDVETKQVYGISLQQKRNTAKIDGKLFSNIVSKKKDVSYLLDAEFGQF